MGCEACGSWSYNDRCDDEDCECACHNYDKAPAQPGDILVYISKDGSEGGRQIVASGGYSVTEEKRGCGCGGCYDTVAKVHVRVFGEESELVIAKGGGCIRVLPIEEFSETWGWPPESHRLLRDGKVLWEPKPKAEEEVA